MPVLADSWMIVVFVLLLVATVFVLRAERFARVIVDESFERLVREVGDVAVARRLVRFERELAPDLDASRAARAALRRLVRERRR